MKLIKIEITNTRLTKYRICVNIVNAIYPLFAKYSKMVRTDKPISSYMVLKNIQNITSNIEINLNEIE